MVLATPQDPARKEERVAVRLLLDAFLDGLRRRRWAYGETARIDARRGRAPCVAENGRRVPGTLGGEPEPDLSTVGALIDEVERQAALLTAVATRGADFRLKQVQRQYRDRRRRLVGALQQRGLAYSFRWQDLSEWYGYWTGHDIADLCRAPGDHPRARRTDHRALEQQPSGLRVSDPGSGTITWADLEERVSGLVAELDGAINRDDLQDFGRRSREILIDCPKLLADPSLVPAGQDPPKAGDTKRWLDLFLAAWASESHRDELRRFIRAA